MNTESGYLVSSGWREQVSSSPWRWELKSIPGVYYLLADALAVQRNLDAQRPGRKPRQKG